MRVFVDEATQLLQSPQRRAIFGPPANNFQEGPLRHQISVHNPKSKLRPPFSPVNDALRPGNAMTEEIP